MTASLPDPPPVRGRVLDARLHLLDRQVLDLEGQPVTTVDDLELADLQHGERREAEPPTISALISGPILTTRLFGGRTPRTRLHRIAWDQVTEIDIVLTLGVPGDALEVTWFERWLAEHVIGRIPGGRHAPD
ncbi:MAG TPA: hypothetical protein VGO26_09185 [Amnibacterium sp.]|jgi:hypothetical protein|nr:hypothetical protein [Amnibacterium sp.]